MLRPRGDTNGGLIGLRFVSDVPDAAGIKHSSSRDTNADGAVIVTYARRPPLTHFGRKFWVMAGALLYVLGSSECESKLIKEMRTPWRSIPKEDTLRC